MSLEFSGYSVKIKCGDKVICTGSSDVGEYCSYQTAVMHAMSTVEFRDFINKSDKLYDEVDLKIERMAILNMPR